MAITTKSVDTIVKEALIEAKLPLHFYVEFMYWALKETDELARRYGMNAKRVEITVNSYNRSSLPSDFVTPIDVSVRSAEKLESLPRNKELNKEYNYNSSGSKIAWPDDANQRYVYTYENGVSSTASLKRGVGHSGGIYGLSTTPLYEWDIDHENQELVFSNGLTDDLTVVLTYVPTTIEASIENVLEHHFVNTVKAFIHYMRSEANRDPVSVVERRKQLYMNAKRVMKAYVQPISYATLLSHIRRGYFAAPKY